MAIDFSKGLEGIIAGESSVSLVDGKNGRLLYRGYRIEDLGEHASFEEVVHLLVYGSLPTHAQLTKLKRHLSNRAPLPIHLVHIMEEFCPKLLPIDALRSTVSLLKCYDPRPDDHSREANVERGLDLIAKFPTIAATYYRINTDQKPLPPQGSSQAERFLWTLTGKKPDTLSTRVIDLDMTLHAEHSFNASTFAARVTTSTLADMYAAITSAVATLEGPLHGGAAYQVVSMLERIGRADKVPAFIEHAFATKERIMGFGHREYKVIDPRVKTLRALADEATKKAGDQRLYLILRAMEKEMSARGMDKKGICPNVDLYTGTVYRALGIPETLYDPLFALGRISGWVAHVLEQLDDNRLIRPRALYVGAKELKWVPMEKRK